MKKHERGINVQEHLLPDGSMSSELREFLLDAKKSMEKNAVDHKQPPWVAFPKYDRFSMGWRMGAGEDYWHAFHSWVRSLDRQEYASFVLAYPEPEGWSGFFDTIDVDS